MFARRPSSNAAYGGSESRSSISSRQLREHTERLRSCSCKKKRDCCRALEQAAMLHNQNLEEAGHPRVILAELIAARQYTGPVC